MNPSPSSESVNAIRSFLTHERWEYSFAEDAGSFSFDLFIECPIKPLSYKIIIHDNGIIILSTLPIGIQVDDQDMMNSICVVLNAANSTINNGNITMDPRSGAIRFKPYIDCTNDRPPTQRTIRNHIYQIANTIENYCDVIIRIILNTQDADTGCAKPDLDELPVIYECPLPSYNVKDLLSTFINEHTNITNAAKFTKNGNNYLPSNPK